MALRSSLASTESIPDSVLPCKIVSLPKESSLPVYYDLVISGTGIGGLSAAAVAAKINNGRELRILLIDKRDAYFNRSQGVILSTFSKSVFLRMVDNFVTIPPCYQKTCFEFFHSTVHSIKDLQRFALDMITSFSNNIDVSFNSEIMDIDLKEGKLKLIKSSDGDSAKIEVLFKHFSIAEGENSSTIELYNRNHPADKISYIPLTNHYHPYHMSFYLTLSRKDGGQLKFDQDFYSLPYSRDKHNLSLYLSLNLQGKKFLREKTFVKGGLVGAIPKELYHLIKHKIPLALESAESFARNLINSHFKKLKIILAEDDLLVRIVKPECKTSPKDKFKLSTFEMTNRRKVDRVLIHQNGHFMSIIGDSANSSFYPASGGANGAIQSAVAFGALLESNMSPERVVKFNSQWNELVSKNEREVKIFNLFCRSGTGLRLMGLLTEKRGMSFKNDLCQNNKELEKLLRKKVRPDFKYENTRNFSSNKKIILCAIIATIVVIGFSGCDRDQLLLFLMAFVILSLTQQINADQLIMKDRELKGKLSLFSQEKVTKSEYIDQHQAIKHSPYI